MSRYIKPPAFEHSPCCTTCPVCMRKRLPDLKPGTRVVWTNASTGQPTDGWVIDMRLCSGDREWAVIYQTKKFPGTPWLVHLDDVVFVS